MNLDVRGDRVSSGFPRWAGASERLRHLMGYAVLAPSRHNSQPWWFEIEGPELRIYGDWRRRLGGADPDGRQLVMGCGAALYNVEVAARHFGHAVSVENVAGSRKDGMLARLTLEEGCPPDPEVSKAFAAIPRRRTNRFGFDAREVPAGLVAALVRSAALHGTRLYVADDALRPAVAELVGEACREQWASARFRAELGAWCRFDASAMDGMPAHALGLSEPASILKAILLRIGSGSSPEERRDRQYAVHARALVAMTTPRDIPADWFTAGRALQAVLLRATAEGLSASFFSNAIEVPAVRERLRQALGMRGWPHLLFRIGYGREVRPTPRRSPAHVLRSISSGPPLHALMELPRNEVRV